MAPSVPAEELVRMGILVRIPPALRSYTHGQDEVVIEATNLTHAMEVLETSFPGIRTRVVDEAGQRRPYVNLFVNEELVASPLSDTRFRRGDVVHILPSVAGG